jgi:hypothetical protein
MTSSTSYDFLPEHWDIIKSYAGIYHLRTDWDLMKLDNNVISSILKMVSPKFVYVQNINDKNRNYKIEKFKSNEERMRCIWNHLHKKKLYDVNKLLNNLIKKQILI